MGNVLSKVSSRKSLGERVRAAVGELKPPIGVWLSTLDNVYCEQCLVDIVYCLCRTSKRTQILVVEESPVDLPW